MMELVRPQSQASGMSGHSDMVWIPGGTFRMRSDRHYTEEAPVHRVTVDDGCLPEVMIPRKLLKGGWHLRAASYCRRYRPASRHPEPADTSTSHAGFRCIIRQAGAAP